jgi:squalene synthase HpnC
MTADALDPRTPPIRLLDRLGPDADPVGPPPAPDAALAYCRGLARSHYENFSVLTGLVPRALRDDFAAVYAFCRWSDDLGDETGSTPEARERSERLLGWWREGLHACHASATDSSGPRAAPACRHPVYVALAETFRRHPVLGRKPFDDLIDAFVQDQRVTRYDTWDRCVDYCTRSANPVGRIVLGLGGYAETPDNAERFAMSDATCTALQLINFWQDVRRDLLERDRVYLPALDTGITPDTLRDWIDRSDDPSARVAYIRALRPLIERTRELFDRGEPLPGLLRRDLAPVVRLFHDGGVAILRAVERSGCATLWTRPRLGKLTKAALLARAYGRVLAGRA